MKLNTQPLLVVAARLAGEGYLERETFERRRSTLTTLEGYLVTKEEHLSVYEEGRERHALGGTELAWQRWRAEHQLVTITRAEVARLESVIRLELEILEREVAVAQQRRARAASLLASKEARA